MAKKVARKGSKKVAKSAAKTISVTFTPAQQRLAEKCLARSGKIVIGFKDISVTRLPKRLKPAMVVED